MGLSKEYDGFVRAVVKAIADFEGEPVTCQMVRSNLVDRGFTIKGREIAQAVETILESPNNEFEIAVIESADAVLEFGIRPTDRFWD
jgi:hypothetical protein